MNSYCSVAISSQTGVRDFTSGNILKAPASGELAISSHKGYPDDQYWEAQHMHFLAVGGNVVASTDKLLKLPSIPKSLIETYIKDNRITIVRLAEEDGTITIDNNNEVIIEHYSYFIS